MLYSFFMGPNQACKLVSGKWDLKLCSLISFFAFDLTKTNAPTKGRTEGKEDTKNKKYNKNKK